MTKTKRGARQGAATETVEDLRVLIRAVTAERDERNARLADLQARLKAASGAN